MARELLMGALKRHRHFRVVDSASTAQETVIVRCELGRPKRCPAHCDAGGWAFERLRSFTSDP